jgi:microcystin-dependent protein
VSEPFLSEIKIVGFNFAPKGWALCNGQLLPINQNQALFSLLGTTFGGNGQTTFALPDLRGRVPIHVGGSHVLGERAGEQAHTLNIQELPTHLHVLQATSNASTTDTPDTTVMLATAALDIYRQPTTLVAMEPGIVGPVGGSQAHQNMEPFLTLTFCIALQGIFPSPN